MREPTEVELKWLSRFTAGAVGMTGAHSLKDQLELAWDKERVDEQAKKDKLLADALGRIEKIKEDLRKYSAVEQQTVDEKGKKQTLEMRRDDGKSEKGFDVFSETKQVKKTTVAGEEVGKVLAPENNFKQMMQLNGFVDKEAFVLSRVMTRRSYEDPDKNVIATRDEPLFGEGEIAEEIFTPLVRDKVIGETNVPKEFSKVQKMLDGSNELYIKECKAKGKSIDTGALELTKGAINLGASVANIITGSVIGGGGTDTASKLAAKNGAARAADITNGIAAALTGSLDLADSAREFLDGADFPVSSLKDAANTIGMGIGRIVGGATANPTLGVLVSDSISAAVTGTAFIATVVEWQKDPSAEPPIDGLIDFIGDSIAAGLAVKSDKVEGADATKFANASTIVSGSFKSIASAKKNDLAGAIRTGKWESVFKVFEDTALASSTMLPNLLVLNPKFNEQDTEYKDASATLKAQQTLAEQVAKGGPAGQKALEELRKMAALNPPKVPDEKLLAELQKRFDEQREKLKKERDAEDETKVKSIEDILKGQQAEYEAALNCLGSDKPNEAEFKSIAKLIEKIERDRAIWDGLTAMFGAGIGAAQGVTAAITAVAAEVAPPLKMAGQLVKYVINLKAAADRMAAWLKWREARKDAMSALSEYGTSIQNFVSSQGSQAAHYSIQAAANAAQALLAAGELSPVAPAFKIAGASVAAAAAAEDLVYKFVKQQLLRKAWKDTKFALEPKNRENRKLGLMVREMNPTLAKYTVAYGAVIAKDPIAITAMNRVGLDRETLARAGDKAADVKKYLVKLYPDDKEVLGMLEVENANVKVPKAELTTKAWTLSCLIWAEKQGMVTKSPPPVAANLKFIETQIAKDRKRFRAKDYEDLLTAIETVASAFRAFRPVNGAGEPIAGIEKHLVEYIALAEAKYMAVDIELGQYELEDAVG